MYFELIIFNNKLYLNMYVAKLKVSIAISRNLVKNKYHK